MELRIKILKDSGEEILQYKNNGIWYDVPKIRDVTDQDDKQCIYCGAATTIVTMNGQTFCDDCY